ncbi:MAG: hypothetical protein Q4B51_08275 [Coriobacteriaceae bacterium]|nr:hypothetical protein [Coriobacteriaceae bacterium]
MELASRVSTRPRPPPALGTRTLADRSGIVLNARPAAEMKADTGPKASPSQDSNMAASAGAQSSAETSDGFPTNLFDF